MLVQAHHSSIFFLCGEVPARRNKNEKFEEDVVKQNRPMRLTQTVGEGKLFCEGKGERQWKEKEAWQEKKGTEYV